MNKPYTINLSLKECYMSGYQSKRKAANDKLKDYNEQSPNS